MEFCKNVELENKIINLLNENVIELGSNKIRNIYKHFRDEYLGVIANLEITKQEKIFISENQQMPNETTLCGIDFPTWFNDFSNANKKIVILGIDPLRNNTAFNHEKADIRKDVLIGTPYALHIKSMRENKTKHYFNLIENLSKENFIYLTDVYKTYYLDSNNVRSYINRNVSNHLELLKKEFEIIKPDIIITFGKIPYVTLTNDNNRKLTDRIIDSTLKSFNNIPIIPMVHLSNSVRPKTYNAFFSNNGINLIQPFLKGNAYGELVLKLINIK